MHAVDTNVVVRVLTRDDLPQVSMADTFISKGAWISHLVLAEAVWVLNRVYGLQHDEVVTAIEMLQSHRDFTLQDADVVAAALDQYRKKPALRFTDCLILEIARKAGHLPLGTFDKNLSKVDGTARL